MPLWIVILLGFMAGLGLPGPALGLDVDFQAWVDRTRIRQSEPLRLTLSIRTTERVHAMPSPQIDLSKFQVEGPAIRTSTNVSIVNFQQELTYIRELTYTLHPRRTGKLLIGPASLELQGQTYQTKALVVDVAASDAPRTTAQDEETDRRSAGRADTLFVRARASRLQAYVGQQISVEYDLCFRTGLQNVGFRQVPSFSGFWMEEVFVAQSLQSRREVIDGVAFDVAPLRQVALFPTRAGIHVIDPLVISCDVPVRPGRRGSPLDGVFDDAFFGRATRTVVVRSDSIHLEVSGLPEKGRPDGFSGAVGSYSMQVESHPAEVTVGDPVSLRVTIEGTGNPDAIVPPAVRVPPEIRRFGPEVQADRHVANGKIGGSRTYEFILIPAVAGEFTLDPVQFAYFDPDLGRYRVLTSPPVRLRSHSNGAELADQRSGPPRISRGIETLGTDIRYIKSDAHRLGGGLRLHARPGFWLAQALLPLGFAGSLLYQHHQQRMQADGAYARHRRARGEAERRLRQARQRMAAGDSAGFHTEVQRAVVTFVADRMNLAAAGLTQDRCVQVLHERGVSGELSRTLRELLDLCDYARFSGGSATVPEMTQTLDRTKRLIAQLEKVI